MASCPAAWFYTTFAVVCHYIFCCQSLGQQKPDFGNTCSFLCISHSRSSSGSLNKSTPVSFSETLLRYWFFNLSLKGGWHCQASRTCLLWFNWLNITNFQRPPEGRDWTENPIDNNQWGKMTNPVLGGRTSPFCWPAKSCPHSQHTQILKHFKIGRSVQWLVLLIPLIDFAFPLSTAKVKDNWVMGLQLCERSLRSKHHQTDEAFNSFHSCVLWLSWW